MLILRLQQAILWTDTQQQEIKEARPCPCLGVTWFLLCLYRLMCSHSAFLGSAHGIRVLQPGSTRSLSSSTEHCLAGVVCLSVHMFKRQKLAWAYGLLLVQFTWDPVNGEGWGVGVTWYRYGCLDPPLSSSGVWVTRYSEERQGLTGSLNVSTTNHPQPNSDFTSSLWYIITEFSKSNLFQNILR